MISFQSNNNQITNKCPLCKLRFDRITLFSTNKSIEVDNKELIIQRDDLVIDAIESEAQLLAQKCEICKKADPNDDHMALICDGCNKIYHTFCMGLKEVPSVEYWFCNDCCHLCDTLGQIKDYQQSQIPSESVSTVILQHDLSDDESEESESVWSPPAGCTNNDDESDSDTHSEFDFGTMRSDKFESSKRKRNRNKSKSKPKQKSKSIKHASNADDVIPIKCGDLFNDKKTLKYRKRRLSQYDCHDNNGNVLTDPGISKLLGWDDNDDVMNNKNGNDNTNTLTTKIRQGSNSRKRKLGEIDNSLNDDASKNENKRRKMMPMPFQRECCNQACRNGDKQDDHDTKCCNFYGMTTKKVGIEIVKNEKGQDVFSLTFAVKRRKKRKKKKKMDRKKRQRLK